MTDIQEVRNYHFTSDDRLLLDANVWLYVYGPNAPNSCLSRIYSRVLSRILEVRSQICIDVLVVSEFINAYARIKWRIEGSDMESFKDYRNCPQFALTANEIADSTRRIVSICHRLESGFQKLDVDALLECYSSGQHDFNDQIIAEICNGSELKLITHDADFRGHEVPILTANQRLLT